MILPKLYSNARVVPQDPNKMDSKTLLPSVNAPSGLEFSYACYLYLDDKNFQGNAPGLRHIFHKGSSSFKPLMCPGVFIKNDSNTLVVYMNEANHWDTKCEIPSFPINKWVHVAIVVRNMNVDVYINGNVAHRIQLSSVPRQNYGDIYVFKNESCSDSGVTPDSPFTVLGAASGYYSRLQYTGYALNYEQIDRMVRAGPSTQVDASEMSATSPPYLADQWWVTYTR
jgi:hypothetical protein